jgi:hypothetical protein
MGMHPDDMEEPTPCMECGEWFELSEGYKSLEGPIMICEKCHEEEVAAAEKEEKVNDLKEKIEELEFDLLQAKKELAELIIE